MAFLNRGRSTKARGETHLNWMGGPSLEVTDPLKRLRLAASSCFFGEPMYYHHDEADLRPRRRTSTKTLSLENIIHLRETLGALDPQEWRWRSPAELMEAAIDDALEAAPAAVLEEAIRLRQEEHIRTTPQVILVRAANHGALRGSGLLRRAAREIILRADEPALGLAYQLAAFGKPIPNALKRAWRDALGRFGEHQLAKYRMERRIVKSVDVVNLVHPAGEAVDGLVRGTLRTTGRTWEAIISRQGNNRQAWHKALPLMGHMALLRNLRNSAAAKVKPERYLDRLVAGAATGRQLPFRYYAAHRALAGCGEAKVLRAVEECLTISLGQLPRFSGRLMALCDNSGSATGTTTSSMGTMKISTIANLTGVLAGMRADEGHLGVFGDRLEPFRVNAAQGLFSSVDRAEATSRHVGGATENGIWLFWDGAIRRREHWDWVFVFSDMQAGHGGLFGLDPQAYADFTWNRSSYIDVARLISTYRRRVNPGVRVFLVQVAGYQDTIVPEYYHRTFILGGWGEGLLRFAAAMEGEESSAFSPS